MKHKYTQVDMLCIWSAGWFAATHEWYFGLLAVACAAMVSGIIEAIVKS